VQELYRSFHFGSGLSEILFSLPPGAQTAGRALAIQIESSSNRLDPRRRNLYRGLKRLLNFWTFMVTKVDPTVTMEDGTEVHIGPVVAGYKRWKIVAPEITPRDNIEATTNVINKVQAKIISLEDGMDELGIDSPLEMKQKIEEERVNPKLFPGDTQAYVAVAQLLLQIKQQEQATQQTQMQPQQAASTAQGQQMMARQEASPTLGQEDNGAGGPQPTTVAGGPPPPFGNQTLIRAQTNGGAQALQQIKIAAPGA
jgi:hypothetical protein